MTEALLLIVLFDIAFGVAASAFLAFCMKRWRLASPRGCRCLFCIWALWWIVAVAAAVGFQSLQDGDPTRAFLLLAAGVVSIAAVALTAGLVVRGRNAHQRRSDGVAELEEEQDG